MTDLRSIPGIGKSSVELLEAAGFPDAETLAKAGVDELAKELERANSILQIAKRPPPRGNVEKWITSARSITGKSEVRQEEEKTVMPVNYESSAEVVTLLQHAPFAIPLPAKFLMDRQLAVGDIPPAILLNRYSGDLEVRVDDGNPTVPKAPQKPAIPAAGNNVRLAETGGTPRFEIDTTRIKNIDVLAGGSTRAATSRPAADGNEDRVALIRGPRLETNKGRDPQSRWYIRGVLHSHPVGLAVGAIVTLLLFVLLPTGIISAALLLLSQELPEHFAWVPRWILVFPLALPLIGIAYLIWGLSGSCRICGQRQFVPRVCLKNSKAHHVPGLGYIIPVCFHMLVFKWFRCTYCGTPVRLKK